jgi:hypothetical protein
MSRIVFPAFAPGNGGGFQKCRNPTNTVLIAERCNVDCMWMNTACLSSAYRRVTALKLICAT